MAGITMCKGVGCSALTKCHRYTSVINEFAQVYFAEVPGKDEKCEYFWHNKGWNDEIPEEKEE